MEMTLLENVSEQQVWDLLETGGVLVTVNRRLARHCQARYAAARTEKGETIWETPEILPYAAWLERSWERRLQSDAPEKIDHRVLLSPDQERMAWETVIDESEAGKGLLHPRDAARAVEQGWRICHQWRIPLGGGPSWAAADPAAFLSWAASFEALCRRNGWLDPARLADAVRRGIAERILPAPTAVVFHGFDEIPPQMADLIGTLQERGCRVGIQAVAHHSGHAARVGFPDEAAEIDAAARWAAAQVKRNPDGRFGVIFPRLEACRETVARVFEDRFHPAGILSPAPPEDLSFNISMGLPLSDYPVIRIALQILDLAENDPETVRFTALLLSPYLAGADRELSRRAILDARLRKYGETRLPVSRLLDRLERMKQEKNGKPGFRCPVFQGRLERFRLACGKLPPRRSPSGWAMTFSNLLDAFGWPGDRPLSSREYQAVTAWREALSRFAGTDGIAPAIDFSEALDALSRMIGNTLFQPESAEAPVQVLGMLESAGERFDALWITGLTQESWPPAPAPNPFIPFDIQRRQDLPHASPERELAFARQATDRLLASAAEVVVSYPTAAGDSHLYPSPLILHLPELPADALALDRSPGYREQLAGTADLEKIVDAQAPPLSDDGTVTGGTGVIKAQAACPFRACVEYRLGGRSLETPVSGLDAARRGTLVHHALELAWNDLKTHRELVGKNSAELDLVISAAVTGAVRKMAAELPETFTERFSALERDRLHQLLAEWLALEKERAPFEVIEKEEKLTVTIGKIRLNTYADRIDRLDDGRRVLVDYKTGDPKPSDWFTGRIAEPQLPLYSIALAEPISAVVFARIKKGKMKYMGIAADDTIIPGVKPVVEDVGPEAGGKDAKDGNEGIAAVVGRWRAGLEALAEELFSGYAPIAPVSIRTSCQYCDVAPICRIGECEYLDGGSKE